MLREKAVAQEKIAGGELYNGMNRLLAYWRDRDADERTKAVPQLAKDLIQLADGYDTQVAQLAAHDSAESA